MKYVRAALLILFVLAVWRFWGGYYDAIDQAPIFSEGFRDMLKGLTGMVIGVWLYYSLYDWTPKP